jgi:AcrR family transcriptional regulator
MTNVKNAPKPTLRQRQAQETRNMIVASAQSLFLDHGYVSTTIEAIAEQAGVAISTVYAIFGSKRGILKAIREAWHGETHIRDVVYGSPREAGSEAWIDQLAQATRLQWEKGSVMVTIYTDAASVDPEAAAELAQALAGRRRGLENFAKSLEPHLRPGLTVARAAAILQALCQPEIYNELVRRSGWSPEEYEDWLEQILKHELLE